jgi:hypothetical protein
MALSFLVGAKNLIRAIELDLSSEEMRARMRLFARSRTRSEGTHPPTGRFLVTLARWITVSTEALKVPSVMIRSLGVRPDQVGIGLWVPKISSTSRHQAILVHEPTEPLGPRDAAEPVTRRSLRQG